MSRKKKVSLDWLESFTSGVLENNERMLEILQKNSDGSKIRDLTEVNDMSAKYEMYAY